MFPHLDVKFELVKAIDRISRDLPAPTLSHKIPNFVINDLTVSSSFL